MKQKENDGTKGRNRIVHNYTGDSGTFVSITDVRK